MSKFNKNSILELLFCIIASLLVVSTGYYFFKALQSSWIWLLKMIGIDLILTAIWLLIIRITDFIDEYTD